MPEREISIHGLARKPARGHHRAAPAKAPEPPPPPFGGSVKVAAEPGFYACVYRFVEIATGRVAMTLTLEVVEVG